ncbi:ferric reductase [Thraustotheca clavata]|uniref:Ferric reductase n=1 Tax=Thraustotheca clavata TaxID=74557 RepID=A0A1W0A5N7_9STRA|nr:ferric reductase [Thraustotheca clavata]
MQRPPHNVLSFIGEDEIKVPKPMDSSTLEYQHITTPEVGCTMIRGKTSNKLTRASKVDCLLRSSAVAVRLSRVSMASSSVMDLAQGLRTSVMDDNFLDSTSSQTFDPKNKLLALKDVLDGIADKNGMVDRQTFSTTFDIMKMHDYVKAPDENEDELWIMDRVDTKALLVDACMELNLDLDEKLRFIFDLFDTDHNESITTEQVARLLEANFAQFKLQAVGTDYNDMAAILFEKAQVGDKMGYIEFRKVFLPLLQSAEDELEEESCYGTNMIPPLRTGFQPYWEKNSLRILWLILYALINAIVFIAKWRCYTFDPALGYGLQIARGCAQVVMLNFLFVLLPMCRSIVQVLKRSNFLWQLIPFDDNIAFHKICGSVLLLAGLIHTGAHVSNEIMLYLVATPEQIQASIFVTRNVSIFANGRPPFSQMLVQLPVVTGVLLLLITLIAFPLAAIPRFRQGKFNLFWYSHLLFMPFLVIGCFHGATSWLSKAQAEYWILPPFLIYLIERRLRYTKMFTIPLRIIRANMYQGTVALYIEKPKKFVYRPGMYLYLNVPAISGFEWHPFTISSAPGDQYIGVHIRDAGDWTHALHELIKNAAMTKEYPSVYIDGPVGAPTQDYHRFKTIVMIGGGIGVTPFASILKDVVHLWEDYRCRNCNCVRHPTSFKIQKMYFHWVTRGQESLGWFQETMNDINSMDRDNVIEMHQYLSTVKKEERAVPLKMFQKFVHQETGHDVISGIKSKQMTHFGRPDWDAVFRDLVRKHPREEIGVFFCGPHPLDKILMEMCQKYSSDPENGGVYFDYHSEKFA